MRSRASRSGLGRIIASRVLTGGGQEIRIFIGTPHRSRPDRSGHVSWECQFQIEGLADSKVQTLNGEDALQALTLAIEGIRVTLDKSGRRFVWFSDEGGSGIPRYIQTGYGERFERRVSAAIEREAKRHWEAKFKSRRADTAELEAEVKERREVLSSLEAALKSRKARLSDWESELKKWKPNKPQ